MTERLGNYQILEHLASGGMAELYVGYREGVAGFRKPVAVKVLRPEMAQNGEIVRMLLDEARLASQIHHPNVIRTEDLGQLDGRYFIVLEYVHGATANQILREVNQARRRLTPAFAVALVSEAAAGLHAAHEATAEDGAPLNIVHRDVSPGNILLSTAGEVKLIDFGVARARIRLHKTANGAVKGKMRYMPPEQLRGATVDRRADVFALGVVLWELLTGRRLFRGMTNDQVIMKLLKGEVPRVSTMLVVPDSLDEAIAQAMMPDVEDRFQTAEEFRRALLAAMPAARRVDREERSALLLGGMGIALNERARKLSERSRGAAFPMRELTQEHSLAVQRHTLPREDPGDIDPGDVPDEATLPLGSAVDE